MIIRFKITVPDKFEDNFIYYISPYGVFKYRYKKSEKFYILYFQNRVLKGGFKSRRKVRKFIIDFIEKRLLYVHEKGLKIYESELFKKTKIDTEFDKDIIDKKYEFTDSDISLGFKFKTFLSLFKLDSSFAIALLDVILLVFSLITIIPILFLLIELLVCKKDSIIYILGNNLIIKYREMRSRSIYLSYLFLSLMSTFFIFIVITILNFILVWRV